ncbi:hypothetical protein N8608_00590 [bacterium]|nr:hypothetical protein [bacterium]
MKLGNEMELRSPTIETVVSTSAREKPLFVVFGEDFNGALPALWNPVLVNESVLG